MSTPSPIDRETVRTRLFTRSLLPLLKVVMVERPAIAKRFANTRATVQFRALGHDEDAIYLLIEAGALEVVHCRTMTPSLDFIFPDLRSLNDFFAGASVRPKIKGLVRHPLLMWRTVGLLGSLRILSPDAEIESAEDRALYVKLVLYMITHALSQLNRCGDPEMRALTEKSPERVYQWTVEETGTAAYLRMHAGRTQSGRGIYKRRRPFVLYTFPTVEGAFRVFTNTGSQMEAVTEGHVRPEGSPEYSRRISVLMQKIDALLTGA